MSADAAGLLFKRVPNLDSDLASYLKSYLDDEASCQTLAIDGDDELLSLLEPALEENGVEGQEMTDLLNNIKDLMLASIGGKTESGHSNKAKALDRVVNLNFNASSTLMPGSVDISSTSKGRNTQGERTSMNLRETYVRCLTKSCLLFQWTWPNLRRLKLNCKIIHCALSFGSGC